MSHLVVPVLDLVLVDIFHAVLIASSVLRYCVAKGAQARTAGWYGAEYTATACIPRYIWCNVRYSSQANQQRQLGFGASKHSEVKRQTGPGSSGSSSTPGVPPSQTPPKPLLDNPPTPPQWRF